MVAAIMQRISLLVVACFATASWSQATPDIPNEKVVVVPMGGPVDAGTAQSAPPPFPVAEQPPPQPAADAPVVPPPERTFEAAPPPLPAPEQLDTNPAAIPPSGPGAMLDGHPREGSFLSGPGSLTFVMHHTLMTGLGVLGTQLVPRAIDASPAHASVDGMRTDGCPPIGDRYAKADPVVGTCSDIVGGEGARIAYLTGTLLGAGIGFTGAAIWQFNNWISQRSANFGIISSFIGGMTLGGFTDLVTQHRDPYATAWLSLIGSSAGAWVAAIVGGGDIPLNKATLIVSGAGWAMIYTGLVVAIVATMGGLPQATAGRVGLDAVMITPALGAGAMALASLKFNPSTAQIIRANIFGVAVGGAVLLLSGLLLGPATGFTRSPLPYILSGVGAIGAKTLVSLLWVDTVDSTESSSSSGDHKYRNVWW